jgi:hypothetical protein
MDALLNRIGVLERRVRTLSLLFLMLLVAVALFALLPSARSSTTETHLRGRSLAVVDEHGVERVLIAAPLPNPVSDGKESQRRSKSYGIQLNDAKGNEFGGFTIAYDGALVSCFDWAQGEATCMFAMPSGEAGFEVKAQKGKTRGQFLLSPDGNVGLTLNDAAERPQVRFRVSADGKTAIELPAAGKQD